MFLKDLSNGHLIEVLSITDLFNPFHEAIVGRYHYGEEVQDPEKFKKTNLIFLSGEILPRCWTDPHYREDEVKK